MITIGKRRGFGDRGERGPGSFLEDCVFQNESEDERRRREVEFLAGELVIANRGFMQVQSAELRCGWKVGWRL